MKNLMKKLSAAILILLLAFSFSSNSNVVYASDELEILAGENKTIDVSAGEIVLLRFVPEVSGIYSFTSLSSDDTYGYLYDSDKVQITYNDDGGSNRQFLITRELEAGVTYYWGAKYYSSSNSGSFQVVLTCDEAYCAHANTYQEESWAATCYEDGCTGGVYCTDCNTYATPQEILPASHADVNADGICDSCSKGMPTAIGNCPGSEDDSEIANHVRYYLYADGELELFGSGQVSSYAFDYRDDITKVTIHEGVTSIGYEAFEGCENLESVTLPNTMTAIGNYAFAWCYNLKNVTIGDSLNKIGDYAFQYCSDLVKITIPASVTEIGTGAFRYDSYPKTIIWCNLGSYAETYAIENALPYVSINGGDASNVFSGKLGPKFNWKLDKRTGLLEFEGSGAIPSLADATAPWDSYRAYITAISLPSGVTEIGSCVFDGLYKLENVYVPSVEDWLGITFNDLPLSKDYSSWPDRNLYIGGELVVDLVVPDGVTEIKNNAFFGCSSLKTITLPSSLTTIGYQAFYKCTGLESITFPSKLEKIENYAFEYCKSLKQVTIPASVSSIGYYCFYGCESLASVEFKLTSANWSKLRVIQSSTFYNTGLKEIVVPASVDCITSSAFPGTIEKITVLNPNCTISDNCGATFNTAICGFEDSTAEQFASDKSFFFENYEDEHTHSYKAITSPAHCSRKRCTCGKEQIVEHVDTNKDVKCDKCGKTTDAISLSKTTSVPLVHEETVMLSFTATKDAKFTFKVTGLNTYKSVVLYNEANEELYWTSSNSDGIAQVVRELKKGEHVFLKITNDESVRTVKVSVSSHVHTYTKEVTRAATCTMSGWAKYTCACGEGSYEESIPALGHKYATTYTVDKKATAAEHGSRSKHCTRTGCTVKDSVKTIYRIETIKLNKTKFAYTGKQITPGLTIKDSNGTALVKGTDYTVKYADGRTETGKYTVKITFKGKYSGTKTLSFYILPKATSKVTVTQTTTTVKATWKKVTGASGYKVQLLNASGKEVKDPVYTTNLTTTFKGLSKGTTYKVKVTAYKTISGTKHYSLSSKTVKTATKPAAPASVKVTAGTKKATLTWKKVNCTGYQIQYSTSSDFSNAKTVSVTSSTTLKKTISKLTTGKKYYFRVRAYKTVGDVTIYGAYSTKVNVKIK